MLRAEDGYDRSFWLDSIRKACKVNAHAVTTSQRSWVVTWRASGAGTVVGDDCPSLAPRSSTPPPGRFRNEADACVCHP